MRRILAVDDNRHVRRAIGGWLRHCGFRIAIADGSTDGLAALDDASFDLRIVDILMLSMRGFESVRLFHQRAPAVPLIAISGYAFAPATLLGMIDECLSEVEPHRRYTAALAALAGAVSEQRSGTTVSSVERVVTGRTAGGRARLAAFVGTAHENRGRSTRTRTWGVLDRLGGA